MKDIYIMPYMETIECTKEDVIVTSGDSGSTGTTETIGRYPIETDNDTSYGPLH